MGKSDKRPREGPALKPGEQEDYGTRSRQLVLARQYCPL